MVDDTFELFEYINEQWYKNADIDDNGIVNSTDLNILTDYVEGRIPNLP